MKTWALCCLALLAVGCGLDPRPRALSRGIDQVRSVLADPKLRSLADKDSKGALEDRLVQALFSAEGKKLWPSRLDAEFNFSTADQSRLPGRVAYLREPELPWAVVVRPDLKAHRIWLLGYGMSLSEPMFQDSVSVTP